MGGAAADSQFSCLPQLRFHIKYDPVSPLHVQSTFLYFLKGTPHLSGSRPSWTVVDGPCLSEEPGSAGAECSTCIRPLNYSALWIIESRHSSLGPRLGAPASQLPTVWNIWGRSKIRGEQSRFFEPEQWDNWSSGTATNVTESNFWQRLRSLFCCAASSHLIQKSLGDILAWHTVCAVGHRAVSQQWGSGSVPAQAFFWRFPVWVWSKSLRLIGDSKRSLSDWCMCPWMNRWPPWPGRLSLGGVPAEMQTLCFGLDQEWQHWSVFLKSSYLILMKLP